MNAKRFFRQVHYWLSLAVLVPSGIIIMAGIVLMLKKDIAWIQPPAQKGEVRWDEPAVSFAQILDAARSAPEASVDDWTDIARVDVRPKDGMAKVTAQSGWEVQVDTATGEVLSVAYRRSDLIESIHDGSFFAPWAKLYIFLPTGVLLLIMWGTGIYLFLLPQLAKQKKRASSAAPNRSHQAAE